MAGLKDWMGRIPDDVSLSAISIPGTHDSGTYRLDNSRYLEVVINPVVSRLARLTQCQSLDIGEQLEAGVRFLDLRIKPGENFPLYHGVVPMMIDLGDVLGVVHQFLKDHPTETVLTCIKCESDDDRATVSRELKSYLKGRPIPMFMESRMPNLGEVRGQAVLINRIFETEGAGIFLLFDDNAIFAKDQLQGDEKTKIKFACQDVYNPDVGFFENRKTLKKKKIEEGYRKYSSGSYDLRLSFISASSSMGTQTPGDYAEDFNAEVGGWLRDFTGGAPWITILDYVGKYGKGIADPVGAIVSNNVLLTGRRTGLRDTLRSGESLKPGESLLSPNQQWEAVLQTDGNFVVYRAMDGLPVFASHTMGKAVDRATLQDDGNFVLYEGDKAHAATVTDGRGKGRLAMQDDGNLVMYDAGGTARWASKSDRMDLRS